MGIGVGIALVTGWLPFICESSTAPDDLVLDPFYRKGFTSILLQADTVSRPMSRRWE